MLGLGTHAGYILASYGVAVVLLAGVVVWILADHRAQRRALAALEARGVRRCSGRGEVDAARAADRSADGAEAAR